MSKASLFGVGAISRFNGAKVIFWPFTLKV
ncbi:hypothetical protein COLO4_07973 [Corchorus olitorius]|uniref:Uncharacterized protein n=1 Tax=Corchorus olitorius TaxID=93759 RepID=A0A1R3KHY7_9ROSI|nr:hypothetical protein COLO4_07973 [Corchorus olitorius]